MKAAVCISCCDDLQKLLVTVKDYYSQKAESVSVVSYFNYSDLICDPGIGSIDILFIDKAYLGGISVPDCHDQLRGKGFRGSLVLYVHAPSAADAVCGLRSAYILKEPLTERSVNALLETISEACPRYLTVCAGYSIIHIEQRNILYIETEGNGCSVHTAKNGLYRLNSTLSSLQKYLDGTFIRCHRSYIVNLAHVELLDTDFVMDNGDHVLIRQGSRKCIREKFLYFLGKCSDGKP